MAGSCKRERYFWVSRFSLLLIHRPAPGRCTHARFQDRYLQISRVFWSFFGPSPFLFSGDGVCVGFLFLFCERKSFTRSTVVSSSSSRDSPALHEELFKGEEGEKFRDGERRAKWRQKFVKFKTFRCRDRRKNGDGKFNFPSSGWGAGANDFRRKIQRLPFFLTLFSA